MTATGPLRPPGWHPDPSGRPFWRWWDGTGWTDRTWWSPGPWSPGGSPMPGGSGWPGGPPAAGEPSAAERKRRRWAPADGGWGRPAPPDDTGDRAPRIPARAAWWALLGILVGEALGLVLAVTAAGATGNSNGSGVILAGEIGLWAGLLGTCLFVSRRYGSGSLRRDFGLAARRWDVLAGLGAWAGGLVVAGVLGSLFAHTRFSGSNTQLLTGQKHSGVGFVVVTLIAALGAPFFEELFFRGLLRTALAARLGPVGAVWAQAGFFGLAHFQPSTGLGNVSVIVVIAGFGVVLGYTAHFTRRLAGGMIAHGLFNTLVAILVFTT